MCKLSIFVNFSSTQLLSPPALWRFGCSPVICKSPEVGVTIGSENKLCVVSESSHLPGSETYCNARYLVPCGLCGNWIFSFLYWIPFEICGTWVHMDLVTEQSSSKNSWRGATSEETGKNLTTARCPVSWRAPPAARQLWLWEEWPLRLYFWLHHCAWLQAGRGHPLRVPSCPDGLLDREQALRKALGVRKWARKDSGMLSPLQMDKYQCLFGSPCLQMSLVGQHN